MNTPTKKTTRTRPLSRSTKTTPSQTSKPSDNHETALVTAGKLRQFCEVTVKCVELAFKLNLIFTDRPDIWRREDVYSKIQILSTALSSAMPRPIHQLFMVANAGSGWAERIEMDGTPLDTYHRVAVYLLMILVPVTRRDAEGRLQEPERMNPFPPLNRRYAIISDIRNEVARALAWLKRTDATEYEKQDEGTMIMCDLDRESLRLVQQAIVELEVKIDESLGRTSDLVTIEMARAVKQQQHATAATVGKRLSPDAAQERIQKLHQAEARFLRPNAIVINAGSKPAKSPTVTGIEKARAAKKAKDEEKARNLCEPWLKRMTGKPKGYRSEAARKVAASKLANEKITDEAKVKKVIRAVKHCGEWDKDR